MTRALFKEAWYRAHDWLGWTRRAQRRSRSALRIVTYHGVQDDPCPVVNYDRLQVDPILFMRQIEWLAREYDIRLLGEVIASTPPGAPWPEGTLCITFDDGYENNAEIAVPVLRRAGVPATFFIAEGYLDGTDYPWWYMLRAAIADTRCSVAPAPGSHINKLSLATPHLRARAAQRWEAWLANQPLHARESLLAKLLETLSVSVRQPYRMMRPEQLQRLLGEGHEIGAHTVRHLSFRHESIKTLRADLADATARLNARAPRVRLLAYPYGHLPDAMDPVRELLHDFGYSAAVTTRMGSNLNAIDRFQLRRLDLHGNRSAAGVRYLAACAHG